MTPEQMRATARAFEKGRRLWSKVNKVIADEMESWGHDTEAITAHIAFLGMLDAQTTDSLETCPLPDEMRTLLRVAAAQDYRDMKADIQGA